MVFLSRVVDILFEQKQKSCTEKSGDTHASLSHQMMRALCLSTMQAKQTKEYKSATRNLTKETDAPHQVEKQLAAGTVVEHKEKLIPRLEGHVQPHDEGVLHVPQHIALGLRVLHLRHHHISFVTKNWHGFWTISEWKTWSGGYGER